MRVGSLEISVVPDDEAPRDVAARVFEEDTFLVLSAPPEIPEKGPHPIRVMTGVLEVEAKPLGTIIEARSFHWLLVLHDLEQTPSTTPALIASGLRAVLDHAEHKGAAAIAVPMLGVSYGALKLADASQLYRETFEAKWYHRLRKVHLVAPADRYDELLSQW